MMEILQAEIVAYSSPKESFVNGPSGDSGSPSAAKECKSIDMTGKRRTACWIRLSGDSSCGKPEGACAKLGTKKCAGKSVWLRFAFFASPSRTLRLRALGCRKCQARGGTSGPALSKVEGTFAPTWRYT